MKLKEFEGKELLSQAGVKVPKGFVISSSKDERLASLDHDVVLKAHILQGGRGKAGLIQLATPEEAPSVAKKLLSKELKGEKVKELLVEDKLEIEKELYMALTINRSAKSIYLLFSRHGGVDIEELAQKKPTEVLRVPFNKFNYKWTMKQFQNYGFFVPQAGTVAGRLLEVMKATDAELVEVNPLAVVHGEMIAADAKIILDDNALFRHPEFKKNEEEGLTETEKLAHSKGLAYVELEGDIAVIGNGAGLVMATLDVLEHFKGKPANFLDVGGGADVKKMEAALEVVLSKKPSPKAVLINIFGGITKCNDIANGLVNYKKRKGIKQPLVVRMIGTNESEGKEVLEANGITSVDSMEEAAKAVVKLVE